MIAGLLLLALAGGTAVTDDPYHNQGPLVFLRKDISKPRPIGNLTRTDQVLRWTSSTLIVADWLTTIDGLRKGYSETNPLLGRRPALGKVNLMIGAGLLTNAFLVPKLKDPELRRAVWFAVLLLEMEAVRNNYSVGCRFNFSL